MIQTIYDENGRITQVLQGTPEELIAYLKLAMTGGFMPFRIHDKEDKHD